MDGDFFWMGTQAAKRMTLAVRMAKKRLVNGIPFQMGTCVLMFSRKRSQFLKAFLWSKDASSLKL